MKKFPSDRRAETRLHELRLLIKHGRFDEAAAA